ncbi:MAG: aspartate ammonia-lyase [Chloroflexi bacterium]|nr:aspartate ammonia-lyase [Chloroflexota bacterium]
MSFRVERDSLGERQVPAEVYYGIQSLRATENYPISGQRLHPYMNRAAAYVKKAAALTNMALEALDERLGQAIVAAADEVLAGRWQDQFVVDAFMSGAGVSYHMNVNEVLANRAIELLGGQKGDYSLIHPNDHVNLGQSTNDVFPTAARLAALFLISELLPVIEEAERAFREKADQFDAIIKSGRTHMQDAVPIRLGQEFGAYATTIARNGDRIRKAAESLHELNLGGTAVGTGLNAHPRYREKVVTQLSQLTGLPLCSAPDLIETTQNPDALAEVSSTLRLLAANLLKISNDLMLMSSGPRTGLAEIHLPALQPGSSIMPGKVNPVMLEMLNMVCYQIMGNDLVVAMACQGGQQELNVYMPVMTHNLLQSLEIMKNALKVFVHRCLKGIEADEERCRHFFEESVGLATLLSPYVGYAKAAEIAQEALVKGKGVRLVIMEKGLLTPQQLEELFSPQRVTNPSRPQRQAGN